MNPQVAGITDVGALRTANQDAIDWRVSEDNRQVLLVVADGMGGHEAGDVASQMVTQALKQLHRALVAPYRNIGGCKISP